MLGLVLATAVAGASTGSARGEFFSDGPGARAIDRASLADAGPIVFVVSGAGLAAGMHRYRCRVFDGKGREVFSIGYDVTPDDAGRWRGVIRYRPDRDADAPGRWRFAAELDGRPLLDQGIDVLAGE